MFSVPVLVFWGTESAKVRKKWQKTPIVLKKAAFAISIAFINPNCLQIEIKLQIKFGLCNKNVIFARNNLNVHVRGCARHELGFLK